VRVWDWIGRGRAEEGEEERGRGRVKAALVLLLRKALVLVIATRRRSSREAWTRSMVVMVSRGACCLLPERAGPRVLLLMVDD
jgi:hypothetical protein